MLADVVDSTDANETEEVVITVSDVDVVAGVLADVVAAPVTVIPAWYVVLVPVQVAPGWQHSRLPPVSMKQYSSGLQK